MCIIIDANARSAYLRADIDMIPVKNWIDNGGKLAFSPTKKFLSESSREFDLFLAVLKQKDQLNEISPKDLAVEEAKIKKSYQLKSNDIHILALARIAGVNLIVSKDKKLGKDFKNRQLINGGRIYKDASHAPLLDTVKCN